MKRQLPKWMTNVCVIEFRKKLIKIKVLFFQLASHMMICRMFWSEEIWRANPNSLSLRWEETAGLKFFESDLQCNDCAWLRTWFVFTVWPEWMQRPLYTVTPYHKSFPRFLAFIPQDQFAVLQSCPGASSLLQEHHVLVQSQIKRPANTICSMITFVY